METSISKMSISNIKDWKKSVVSDSSMNIEDKILRLEIMRHRVQLILIKRGYKFA